MNLINRDLTYDEKHTIRRDIETITEMVDRIKNGKNQIEDYPDEIQEVLKLLLKYNISILRKL